METKTKKMLVRITFSKNSETLTQEYDITYDERLLADDRKMIDIKNAIIRKLMFKYGKIDVEKIEVIIYRKERDKV